MSDIRFTTEQETAIALRDKNLLVNASAGTGKTTVLVERIIRMAIDPIKTIGLDRMLVVTFTNAAAEEMRVRIRNALYKEIKKNPKNAELRKQLILLRQASISTIHSFCMEVIRNNSQLLDIDPGFAVGDANETDLFLQEAIEKVLTMAYDAGEEAFVALVDSYGRGRDDELLAILLKSFYKKIRSIPSYRSWIKNNRLRFTVNTDDFAKTEWGKAILSYSASRLSGYIADIEDLLNYIVDDEAFAGYEKTLLLELNMMKEVLDLLLKKSWDECNLKVSSVGFERIGRVKKGASDKLKKIILSTRKDYKSEIDRIKKRLTGNSREIFDNMAKLQPIMEMLGYLLLQIDEEYKEMKKRNGVLDYNDLEHLALECLSSDAGDMYRERFDEIFIDEYQDSNQIQESIINSIAGRGRNEKNVFMVGDIKQSIYRFRQAEPGIFLQKYNTFSKDIKKPDVSVNLFRNYRSRIPILDFANYLFAHIMSKEMGDIDYKEDVYLKQGKEFPFGNDGDYPVEIKLICGEDKQLFDKDISSEEKEAAVVGDEIKKIINSEMLIVDKSNGQKRKVVFGDFSILLRNANKASFSYTRQLRRMGIPVQSDNDSDFFKEYEIAVIKSFLEILDNPRRDIPLLTLLRSSIFGFTDKELAYIRVGEKKLCFYESMMKFKANIALREKIDKFKKVVSDFRQRAVLLSMDKLVWSIIHETGYYTQTSPDEETPVRMNNLRKLFEIAGQYEQSRAKGLFGFIEYLDKIQKNGATGLKGTVNKENAVKIMSIHKSKGLEFPVVFLSGCGKQFNKMDIKDSILFDREFGFGPDYVNSRMGYKLTTAVKKSIKIKKETENLAEEMRVLYVALTRAREKLVITGYVKNIETAVERWILRGQKINGKIFPGKIMLAAGYIDWIMSALINNDRIYEELVEQKPSTSKEGKVNLAADVSIIDAEIISNLIKQEIGKEEFVENKVNLSYEEMKKRCEWEYPYIAERGFHKKVSVTEIKKLAGDHNGEKDIFGLSFIPGPDFLNDFDKTDAVRIGTLLHNVIAVIEPGHAFKPGYIESLFKKAGTGEDKIEEYTQLVKGFFEGELGRRMLSSLKIESEKPFLLPFLTSELYPDRSNLPEKSHTTLVQGVIDCLFYEKDGIVIIDYKSDNVSLGDEAEHAARYYLQLKLYAEAVERLIGIPVKEKYIYFFRTKSEVLLV